ncbi:MAG: hypothetical protein IJ872_05035, partial [Eubacterium sp.]|nr:hypothetical protein [Eubacterium sp.]
YKRRFNEEPFTKEEQAQLTGTLREKLKDDREILHEKLEVGKERMKETRETIKESINEHIPRRKEE